jgi:hypothetical protein
MLNMATNENWYYIIGWRDRVNRVRVSCYGGEKNIWDRKRDGVCNKMWGGLIICIPPGVQTFPSEIKSSSHLKIQCVRIVTSSTLRPHRY